MVATTMRRIPRGLVRRLSSRATAVAEDVGWHKGCPGDAQTFRGRVGRHLAGDIMASCGGAYVPRPLVMVSWLTSCRPWACLMQRRRVRESSVCYFARQLALARRPSCTAPDTADKILTGVMLVSNRPELTELVKAAQGGDKVAFGQIFEQFQPTVARAVLAVFPCNAEELKDVTLEVWAAVWKGLPSLRRADSFASWLFAVATKRARSAARKYKRRMEALAPENLECISDVRGSEIHHADDPSADPASGLFREVSNLAVVRALLQLPWKQRAAFCLRVLADPPWSFEEIGQRIGTTAVGARVAYCRACKRLRSVWRPEMS
jgi:RNA polymerase sigma factor (sigma-70 family)